MTQTALTLPVQNALDSMIVRSKTKLIAPVLTVGVLRRHLEEGATEFTDQEMRSAYETEVCRTVREVLHHTLCIGGHYEDAYSSRTLPKYGVVSAIGDKRYRLTQQFAKQAGAAITYIRQRIPEQVAQRLGGVARLQSAAGRLAAAAESEGFANLLTVEMQHSAGHFEIVSFAILKVHLEKFACKVYRSSRTSAHDRGVDIATDYGAVYQIKKLRLRSQEDVEEVYSELLTNFDAGRLADKKVVLVIDDLSTMCRQYLIDMRVQPLVREDILTLARLITDPEDRQKILRIVYEEFEREYRSDICMTCRVRPRIEGCSYIPLGETMRPK